MSPAQASALLPRFLNAVIAMASSRERSLRRRLAYAVDGVLVFREDEIPDELKSRYRELCCSPRHAYRKSRPTILIFPKAHPRTTFRSRTALGWHTSLRPCLKRSSTPATRASMGRSTQPCSGKPPDVAGRWTWGAPRLRHHPRREATLSWSREGLAADADLPPEPTEIRPLPCSNTPSAPRGCPMCRPSHQRRPPFRAPGVIPPSPQEGGRRVSGPWHTASGMLDALRG